MLKLPSEITVLGAGLSGLAVAIRLARSGRRVTLLERHSFHHQAGFGIQITPNGAAVLEGLGVWPGCPALAAEAVEICCYRSGVTLLRQPLNSGGMNSRHLLFHRAELVKRMQQLAIEAGVNPVFDTQVETITACADRIDCQLNDGTTHSTPYLIGADGLNSKTSQMLNESESKSISQYLAWRALVEWQDDHVVRLIPAPGCHVVTYPLPGSHLTNVVAVNDMGYSLPLSGPQTASKKALLDTFDRMKSCQEVFDRCENVSAWVLPESKIFQSWSNERAVIIGDALHPMLPFLAQGGNMALEDAWILSKALLSCTSVTEAHRRFREHREARVRRTIGNVVQQSRYYHARGLAEVSRRIILRGINRVSPGLLLQQLHWLFGTDVTADI